MTETATTETATESCALNRRRHAAGADPRKRDQILDGAWRVFVDQGFDAASMNSICKEAGVSKGTLYVYFQSKEDLFVALVENKRNSFFDGLADRLAEAASTEEALLAYGTGIAELLTADEVIRAQRIVIGVVERMPQLGERFFDAGAKHFLGTLGSWLRAEDAAGRLSVQDPDFAAQQFVELATSGIWRARLFGRQSGPPPAEEIVRTAREAVRIFMAAYAPDRQE